MSVWDDGLDNDAASVRLDGTNRVWEEVYWCIESCICDVRCVLEDSGKGDDAEGAIITIARETAHDIVRIVQTLKELL